jgi:hypothetical protein
MSAYLILVASVMLLGLFVDEGKLRLSIKLAILCGFAMILIGWWHDWPAQLARGSSLAPILSFVASRITARYVPVSDKRFHDLPLIMYFSLILTHVAMRAWRP